MTTCYVQMMLRWTVPRSYERTLVQYVVQTVGYLYNLPHNHAESCTNCTIQPHMVDIRPSHLYTCTDPEAERVQFPGSPGWTCSDLDWPSGMRWSKWDILGQSGPGGC